VDHTYGDSRDRHEATVWQRLNRILGVFLVLAVWLGIISLFVPPYKRFMRSRGEIDNLQAQANAQKLLLARQTREVSLLRSDPVYLETIARDRLDLMKDGEVIFRLEVTPNEKRKRDNPARR
jgi:cell division protein FtsB